MKKNRVSHADQHLSSRELEGCATVGITLAGALMVTTSVIDLITQLRNASTVTDTSAVTWLILGLGLLAVGELIELLR